MTFYLNCLVLALLSYPASLLAAAAPDQAPTVLADNLRTLSCYSCQGVDCQRSALANATSQCSDLLDVCVTIFDGLAISERGCLLDISVASRAKCESLLGIGSCHKCMGDLCNNKGRARCIQCHGGENDKCNGEVQDLKPEACAASTSANSYCYVRQLDSGSLQRGCALNLKEQTECLANNKCALCLPEHGLDHEACNTFKLTTTKASGSDSYRTHGLGGLLVVLFAKLFH